MARAADMSVYKSVTSSLGLLSVGTFKGELHQNIVDLCVRGSYRTELKCFRKQLTDDVCEI